jgi:hypothetical protein
LHPTISLSAGELEGAPHKLRCDDDGVWRKELGSQILVRVFLKERNGLITI